MLAASDYWNDMPESSTLVSIRGYVHCLLSNLGYFDDKNGYNIDRILLQLKQIQYFKNSAFQRSVLEKCADNNENNDPPEVWAFRGFRCMMEEVKSEPMSENNRIMFL